MTSFFQSFPGLDSRRPSRLGTKSYLSRDTPDAHRVNLQNAARFKAHGLTPPGCASSANCPRSILHPKRLSLPAGQTASKSYFLFLLGFICSQVDANLGLRLDTALLVSGLSSRLLKTSPQGPQWYLYVIPTNATWTRMLFRNSWMASYAVGLAINPEQHPTYSVLAGHWHQTAYLRTLPATAAANTRAK